MTNVLVIDDDVAVAELMAVVLQDAKFRVSVAHRPSEIPKEHFDCIVTDLVDIDRYSFDDARDWVLRIADRFPKTPIIVVTAHGGARADTQRLGARVLMKPFDVDELVMAVREVTTS